MNHVQSSQTPQEVIDRQRKEPDAIPVTIEEFNKLSFRELQWMYDNRRAVYDRFIKERRKEW